MRFYPSLRLLLAALLAILLAANGIAMLVVPHAWYLAVPGVSATGPLNLHFVRDIGCAYLVCALGFFWLLRDPRAWPAAVAGALFLSLHALVHVGEMVVGVFDLGHLLRDLPGVFLVPLIAFWLALPLHRPSSLKGELPC